MKEKFEISIKTTTTTELMRQLEGQVSDSYEVGSGGDWGI